MKTYYIEIKEQGYIDVLVKVNASSHQEAELKALKTLYSVDSVCKISKKDAKAKLKSGNIDYAIDEDGCAITLDESPEIYIVKCVTKSGEERTYQHDNDQDGAIARARSYWNAGDSEYSKITVHKVMSADEELNDTNCIGVLTREPNKDSKGDK